LGGLLEVQQAGQVCEPSYRHLQVPKRRNWAEIRQQFTAIVTVGRSRLSNRMYAWA
jgi:hypothetical protein